MTDSNMQMDDSDFIRMVDEIKKRRDDLNHELKDLRSKKKNKPKCEPPAFSNGWFAKIAGYITCYTLLLAATSIFIVVFLWGYGFLAEGANQIVECDIVYQVRGRKNLNTISRHGSGVFKDYLGPLVDRVKDDLNIQKKYSKRRLEEDLRRDVNDFYLKLGLELLKNL